MGCQSESSVFRAFFSHRGRPAGVCATASRGSNTLATRPLGSAWRPRGIAVPGPSAAYSLAATALASALKEEIEFSGLVVRSRMEQT
jgi:hypothetical protein